MIWRRGRTSTPSACISITMVVMPACLGASGLVRTVAKPRSLLWASLVQTFWPLTTQPPSTRVPLVLTAAASEPASGSLKSWHQTYSPIKVFSTQRCTWSGVAYWLTVMMFQPVMPRCGTLIAGPLELLIDDQLLHGAGRAPPGNGPVRDHQAGVQQRLALFVAVEVGEGGDFGPHAGPDGLGLGRQVEADATADALVGQGRDVLGVLGAAQQRVQDQGPAQEQVGIVLPGEADPPVHLDVHLGVVDVGGKGQGGGLGRRQGELVGVVVSRAGGVPDHGGGQLGGHQHVGAVVLDGLEGADRPPNWTRSWA